MQSYALSSEQGRKIEKILTVLERQTGAEALVVSDYGGNILASRSSLPQERLETIAALAAGAFAATRELAVRVGEPQFQSIFHQGTGRNMYIHCQSKDFVLVMVTSRATPQGLVKLYAEKVTRLLVPVLQALPGQSASQAGLSERLEYDGEAFPGVIPPRA